MPKEKRRESGGYSRQPSESEMVGLLHKNITFAKSDANQEDSDDSSYFNDNKRGSLRSRNLARKALKSLEGREIDLTGNGQKGNGLTSRHSYNGSTSNKTPLLPPFRRSQSFFHPSITSYIEHDIDEDNFANQFLSTVDKFEDEFDKQAYEELIPFNIRMELENRLFGWNHLYSELLGHILFPLFYYLVTFWAISVFGLKYVPASGEHCSVPAALLKKNCPADDRCSWDCFFHKISFHGHKNDDDNEYNYVPIFGVSVGTFLFLRQFFSLWAALNAFRTVRRRRRVWLRSTAAEYFKDKKRQDEIKEIDEKTLLGKIRRKLQVRRVRKKIQKAEKRFEKRDRIRRDKFIRNSSSFESEHHRRVRRLGRNDRSRNKYSTSDKDNDNKDDLSHLSAGVTDLIKSHRASEIADDFLEVYQKYKNASQISKGNESQRNFYARTMPTYAMQSINMDQIRLKSRIENVPYAHGGFFGAAPFMLANPHWIDILRQLMPDVYVEISRRAVRAPVPQLIHWAENNPVVAAYGTAHELEFSGQVPTLEWDVFLDPHLVQRVEVVLQARDTFIKELMKTSKRIHSLMSRESVQSRYTDKIKAVGVILESGATTRSNERRILEFYNTEIDKRVEVLLENMLIAHGNISQLTLEQTGMMKQFNFSRVKHTRRTLGGGIFAKQWIQTYVEALKMSTKSDSFVPTESSDESTSSASAHDSSSSVEPSPSDDNEDAPLIDQSESRLKREVASFHDLTLATIPPSSISDAMEELKQVIECDAPLGLILDIKSRHVSKRVWALLLDALRKAGARVEGIATFFVEDIRDISKFCSVPVNEIIFHHSAGDVQHACHEGVVKRGDCVFFNAGSLFWNHLSGVKDFSHMLCACLSFDVEQVKKQYKLQPYARIHNRNRECSNEEKEECTEDDIQFIDAVSSTIQQYKDHFDLSLGLYVQEFCVDDEILEIIIEYVNRNKHIYNLGFSWGGVNGMTVQGIQPGRFTNTDGLWNQRYIGNRWDYDRYPTTVPATRDTQIT